MKRLLISILIVLILILSYAIPVLAIDYPDNNPPDIPAVYVYEDLAETGDIGVLVEYFIDYTIAGTPTETVTESYIVAFIDIDGTTQLKAVAPYTFVAGGDSGYNHGLAWIYFTAAEATAIDEADVLLYNVWLMGNPTLTWAGDPPKQTAGITNWYNSTYATNQILASRIITYAGNFETQWSTALDLVSITSVGNRLTTLGAAYFENVITDLREIAPTAFADGTLSPIISDIDYSTSFGATVEDGAVGTVTGSPVTLVSGDNDVDVSGLGDIIITLNTGTYGTATTDICTVAGSPVDLIPGVNTITVGGVIGNIVVNVTLNTPQGQADDNITGTGFDLTTVATAFGMTRAMFSGIVWFLVSILICWACYRIPNFPNKGIIVVFDICIVGGGVLGLMPILVAVLLFIGFVALTGYVLFYRGASF